MRTQLPYRISRNILYRTACLVPCPSTRSHQLQVFCSKARVGMRLLQRCYYSARPMRQLGACGANRGDQRYSYELFTVAQSPTPTCVLPSQAKKFSTHTHIPSTYGDAQSGSRETLHTYSHYRNSLTSHSGYSTATLVRGSLTP